jgi:hypothetical protein
VPNFTQIVRKWECFLVLLPLLDIETLRHNPTSSVSPTKSQVRPKKKCIRFWYYDTRFDTKWYKLIQVDTSWYKLIQVDTHVSESDTVSDSDTTTLDLTSIVRLNVSTDRPAYLSGRHIDHHLEYFILEASVSAVEMTNVSALIGSHTPYPRVQWRSQARFSTTDTPWTWFLR